MKKISKFVIFNGHDFTIKSYYPPKFDKQLRKTIELYWENPIKRKILITLSDLMAEEVNEINYLTIKNKISHSYATVYKEVNELLKVGLISEKLVFKRKKQRLIIPNVIFVPQKKSLWSTFENFLLVVDDKNYKKIYDVLKSNKDSRLTLEEISLKTKLPIDDIELVFLNWAINDVRFWNNPSPVIQRSTYEFNEDFEKKLKSKPLKKIFGIDDD